MFVCVKNTPILFLCSSLKQHVKGLSQSYKIFLKDCCCDTSNEKCMLKKCEGCITDINDILPIVFEYNANISWKQCNRIKIQQLVNLTLKKHLAQLVKQ